MLKSKNSGYLYRSQRLLQGMLWGQGMCYGGEASTQGLLRHPQGPLNGNFRNFRNQWLFKLDRHECEMLV